MYTLGKSERLNKTKTIERLFAEGASSFVLFPLRVVYMTVDAEAETAGTEAPVAILVSVSKRRFKRAVDRNSIKRRIREAYRKNKQLLQPLLPKGMRVVVAFVYIGPDIVPSHKVEQRVLAALKRIGSRLQQSAEP
jgi:ribonuclease P protein component